MTCSFDRRGRSRRAAPPLRASIWAVTVTGDQPPPTRCPAPSQSSPSELFWLALSPVPEGPARKVRSRNARSATSVWCWEPRGPAFKPVTGAAVCAWRGVWAPRLSPVRRRRETQWENEPLRSPGARWAIRAWFRARSTTGSLWLCNSSAERASNPKGESKSWGTEQAVGSGRLYRHRRDRLVFGGRTAARVRTELHPKHRKPARGVNPGG